MECCPACHRPLDGDTRLTALVKDGTDGMTYPETAVFLGRSVKRVQAVVYEHHLEVRYRRIGAHPRRRVFLPPSTIRTLKHLLPQPQPARAQSPR